MLEKIFKLQAHGTTVRTEVLAGITTFLTMAYIIFVNPNVLAKTGMDHGAVFVATCIAAAIGSFIMGFYAHLYRRHATRSHLADGACLRLLLRRALYHRQPVAHPRMAD